MRSLKDLGSEPDLIDVIHLHRYFNGFNFWLIERGKFFRFLIFQWKIYPDIINLHFI